MSDEPARDIDDLATARTLITTLQDELTRVQRENASLRHQLDLLCQRLFGKKSERVTPRVTLGKLLNSSAIACFSCERHLVSARIDRQPRLLGTYFTPGT